MDGNSVKAVGTAGDLAHEIKSAHNGSAPTTVDLRADIKLTEALPVIEAELTIQGNGHSIDGNGFPKTFEVGGEGHLIIKDAKFINGSPELIDAICSIGIVVLTDCVFDCRSDGTHGSIGLYSRKDLPWERKILSEINRGDLDLTNCTFLGDPDRNLGVRIENLDAFRLAHCTFDECTNGKSGVIFNMGDLTATHCVFANNTGMGAGVAIRNEGSVKLSDCMLVNNVATEWFGGALYNDKGDMRLNRCSLLGNSASGGGAILNRKGS